MTLFEILSKNERVIVWSNEETGTIYTWNQYVTLQAFVPICNMHGEFEEVSIRTLSHDPQNFRAAREAAKRWDVDGVNDDR